MKAVLTILWPGKQPEVRVLESGESLRVGRLEENDLVIPLKNVSRQHAVIYALDEGAVLTDLSSKNGTLHNGHPINGPVKLADNDRVRVGDVELAISFIPSEGEESRTGTTTQDSGMGVIKATLLVADVSGYTRLSEALPATEVALILQSWLEAVSKAVSEHGGFVNKLLGDGLLAVWSGNQGGSVENDSAWSAYQAAKTILTETEKLSSSWRHRDQYPWRCAISLNSGEALYGAVRTKDSNEFVVLGDAVNVTFRLNAIAGERREEIVLSRPTAELIGDRAVFRHLGKFAVPGKVEPIEVYGV